MPNPTQPGLFPFHAENIVTELPTVSEGSGYVNGTIANNAVADALGQRQGRWIQYIDLAAPHISDLLSNNAALVRGESLEYATSAGLGPLSPTQTPVILGGGCRIDYNAAQLSLVGLAPSQFQPNKRRYVYGGSPLGPGQNLAIQFEDVAIGAPSNPPGGFALLGGFDTDASDIIALIPSDVPEQVEVNADLLFSGNTDFEQITVTPTSGAGVTVTGDGAVAAVSIDGNGNACLSATATNSRVATLTNDSPGSSTLVLVNSDAAGPALTVSSGTTRLFGAATTIGLSVADTLTVEAATTLEANVTLNASLTGTGQTISATVVQGDTVDTGSTGLATIARTDWYTDVTPASAVNAEQFDGYRLSLGGQPIAAPHMDYVTTATTLANFDDLAGLNVTLEIPNDREVHIEIRARQSSDLSGASVNLGIAATNGVDSVTILNTGADDQAISTLPSQVTNNDVRPNVCEIVWKPTDDFPVPDNTTWTIRGRHGVSGGGGPTLKSVACSLKVTYR